MEKMHRNVAAEEIAKVKAQVTEAIAESMRASQLTDHLHPAALIGWPLGHSASAMMHNDAYKVMGLDSVYVPLPAEPGHISEVVDSMEALGFMGTNVTIPHKVAVIDLLDELDSSASACGAVNTVLFKNGRRIGYNTDGLGFVRGMKDQGHVDPKGKKCLIVGAGGGARGVSTALAAAGITKFYIANRTFSREQHLVNDLNKLYPNIAHGIPLDNHAIAEVLDDVDIIVHATPLGMWPNVDAVAFDTNMLQPRHVVCDIVYNPRQTRLLREAAARGCRTLDGMWMLVYQGAEAVRIWTGKNPPVDVMAKGCERFLQGLKKK